MELYTEKIDGTLHIMHYNFGVGVNQYLLVQVLTRKPPQ